MSREGDPLGRAVELRIVEERSLGSWRSRLPRQSGVLRLAIQAPDLSRAGLTWASLVTGFRVVAHNAGWRGRSPTVSS
jgi:hypothetical protein